jgi:hypothetical protein
VGLQLRGATEWDEPGTYLFSSCVVSVADRAPRTDPQPAPPSGPNPVGSHPVSRGGRAPFDRGNPLRAVRPKFLGASATCTNRAGQGRFAEPPAAYTSRRRWRLRKSHTPPQNNGEPAPVTARLDDWEAVRR